MKKLIPILFSVIILVPISAFKTITEDTTQYKVDYQVPDNINAILDQSCIMCHNKEAKSDKAKKKLLLDEMGDLKKSKLVSKLSKIAKVVIKGEMPPEKFAAKYPDKALSEEDKTTLATWAKNYATELSN